MDDRQRANLIYDALEAWAPSYPRRVGRNQVWADNDAETIRALFDAEGDSENSPFISTYAFPRGHTKEDNIPEIDTLFIDFDFDSGDYVSGSGNGEAWKRDLSHLLVRARRVASVIVDGDSTEAWRASLSGHKGIHLFLDFQTLDPGPAPFHQYVNGINEYATDLVDELAESTGLDDLDRYVDVTSSDLGRLCRVPNTIHGGASNSFGETRYCVPIRLETLASLTADEYESLTLEPRDVDVGRQPSEDVAEIIEQYIQTASDSTASYSTTPGSTIVDWSRVDEYRRKSNDSLTLRDAKFLTSDMPCVWDFHEREDKYDYGNQSHHMESHCIAKLVSSHFPIDVIKEFLSTSPRYNEQYTENRIEELIARDFNPYRSETLLRRAPEFCNPETCLRCRRAVKNNDDLQQMYDHI